MSNIHTSYINPSVILGLNHYYWFFLTINFGFVWGVTWRKRDRMCIIVIKCGFSNCGTRRSISWLIALDTIYPLSIKQTKGQCLAIFFSSTSFASRLIIDHVYNYLESQRLYFATVCAVVPGICVELLHHLNYENGLNSSLFFFFALSFLLLSLSFFPFFFNTCNNVNGYSSFWSFWLFLCNWYR